MGRIRDLAKGLFTSADLEEDKPQTAMEVNYADIDVVCEEQQVYLNKVLLKEQQTIRPLDARLDRLAASFALALAAAEDLHGEGMVKADVRLDGGSTTVIVTAVHNGVSSPLIGVVVTIPKDTVFVIDRIKYNLDTVEGAVSFFSRYVVR